MKSKYHPLRPKQGVVLICENKDDAQFVEKVIIPHTQYRQLTILYGQGKETLPKLAEIFQPAFYLWDRDFGFSVDEARATLTDRKKARIVWSHVDIESYLLYPDWLWKFILDAQSAVIPLKIKNPPTSLAQVEADLKDIAHQLIPDHAGRRAVSLVDYSLRMYMRGRFGVLREIGNDKNISDRETWETGLIQTAQTIREYLKAGMESPELMQITNLYAQEILHYQELADSLSTIRLHFSGKPILKLLANRWGIPGVRRNNIRLEDWRVLTTGLINSAVQYNSRISIGHLSQDERLADFGYVAEKITGKSE